MLGADFARCEAHGGHADVATNVGHQFRVAPDRRANVHDSNTAVEQYSIILSTGENFANLYSTLPCEHCHQSTDMYSEVVHEPEYSELKLEQYLIIKISAGLPHVDNQIKLDLFHCLEFPRHCFRGRSRHWG